MSAFVSMAANSSAIAFPDLGLSPIALDLGFFQLRWYSLAYLAGIFIGYWYLLKLLKQPGAPMARRHADDLVFYSALGIILGGRLGYVLFYNLPYYLDRPLDILKLWDGGMSFHGGVIGTSLGILYLSWKEKLQWLRRPRLCRLLRAVRPVLRPARQFRESGAVGRARPMCPGQSASSNPRPMERRSGLPRHPSQLYEAGLEGLRSVRNPLGHVLAHQGALRTGQAGWRLHLLLRNLPLRRSNSSASPMPSWSNSPMPAASTWGSG